MSFEIKQGDCLSVLKAMPSESVQTCITSPPYYGLRSYGTDPVVWGNHNGCSHVWGETLRYAKQDNRSPELKASQGATVGNSVNSIGFAVGNSGSFCQSCNAWRGELGLEPTFQLYISHLIEIFAEVKRVLKKDGTAFVNLGDSFSGDSPVRSATAEVFSETWDKSQTRTNGGNRRSQVCSVPRKSLMNIPARFAIAMTDDLQMIQRNEIIWHKPACMPSSAKDRFTVDFEPIFFFAKSPRYKFNQQLEAYTEPMNRWGGEKLVASGESIWDEGTGQEWYRDRDMRPNPEGRNKRTVWKVNFEPQSDEHYASYPTKLVEPMILAGTDEGDTVLDVFAGTGTTLLTALRNRRNALGIELQPKYVAIAEKRLAEVQVKLF